MKHVFFSHAKEADICLILEGSYPFAGGGLSHWVSELIRVLPQYRFAIIFLGTSKEDYPGYYGSLFDNIVHLEAHYLFDKNVKPEFSTQNISRKFKKKTEDMHKKFETFITDNSDTMSELFELMGDKKHLNKGLFLRSKASWELLVKRYNEKYSEQSFFDYFWGVRNLHHPFWTLAKIIDDIPTVKILHSSSTGYAGFLGALLQEKYKLPYIITEHGIYTKERWIELMGNYFFEYILQDNTLKNTHRDLVEVWARFFTILAKVSYRAANPIISLFEEYRARQIRDGAQPERTRIIPYGIDFNIYPFIGKKLNKTNPIIAFIGRVVPIKDIKTLIRACALLFIKLPTAKALIVGSTDVDKEYVANCKYLMEMLAIEEKIEFLGEQNVMQIFPKIDVLMLSSISEGSPFVILESFAAGIPVVTTDVGGCRELIEGKDSEDKRLGLAGRLANLGDAEGLCNGALELLTSEMKWNSAQQAAKERIRKYYSMQQLIENYSLIYEEALSHGRNRI
jgi:polysaccharide biosynthesis protein PelF